MALVAVFAITMRDVSTRLIPERIPTLALIVATSVAVTLLGFAMAPFETWVMPTLTHIGQLAAAGMFLLMGYGFIVVAMRRGDVSAVAPFRYSIVLLAIVIGFFVWGELPNLLAVFGIAVVISAGLYTVHRERVRLSPHHAGLASAGTPSDPGTIAGSAASSAVSQDRNAKTLGSPTSDDGQTK